MKKSIFLAAFALIAMVSCKNDSTEIIETKTTHDTITMGTPPPPPPPVETPEAEDGTSVEIGKEGVSVDTKNTNSSTKVEVKDGKAAVEVK